MRLSVTSAVRILIVEENPLFASDLQKQLQTEGYCIALAHTGGDGLLLAEQEAYDLVLLNIRLPDIHGLALLQQLRRRSQVPVLLLSDVCEEHNRIAGFSLGADDYLPRPFSFNELSVRVSAILRRVAYERRGRASDQQKETLHFDNHHDDLVWNGKRAGLTASEYRVLQLLRQHLPRVLSKPFLYQQALCRRYSRHDRSLDMHVSHIRRKLKAMNCHALRLETVWGQGYRLASIQACDPD